MNTRFHEEDRPITRTVPKMRAINRDMGIMEQKTTFHMLQNTSQCTQHVNDKRLPPTGLATTTFQYSKNPERRDPYENIRSSHTTKTHRAPRCNKPPLCAGLPTPHQSRPKVSPLSQLTLEPHPHSARPSLPKRFSTLTIRLSPPTTDPSPGFT